MKKGNRKHIRLLAMAMSLAVVGMLAAFIALAAQPAPAAAQGLCDGPLAPILPQCQDDTPTPGTPPPPPPTPTPATGDMITSDSTSGGAAPELKVVIDSLTNALAVGSSIVLYLEDDYQEPETIPASSVYFVATPPTEKTGSGARVYTTIAPKIDTGAYFDADKKDISIRVFIPDMCTSSTDDCQGQNGVDAGQMLTMVVEDTSGIKNPTEEGTHSVLIDILGPADSIPSASDTLARNDALRATDPSTEQTLPTWAKISLSDVDNRRGYELTVTGSGFNDGTTAAVHVLHDPSVGSVAFDNGANEAALCERITRNGIKVGGALVGSDDRVSVTFEVTALAFSPGNVNYICMVDGEGRMSSTDVEDFNLQPSVRVEPRAVNTGDTAMVYAQDYSNVGAAFTGLRIAGRSQAPNGTSLSTFVVSSSAIGADGSATMTFEVPRGLEGVLRLDAMWGAISEDTKITIGTADLEEAPPPALPAAEPQFVGPITRLTAATQGRPAGSVRLAWTPAQNAQVHFAVHIKSADVTAGNYATAQMVPFAGADGVISGLESGISYHFIVIGMRWNWVEYGTVWGTWSSWQTATP